MSKETRVDKSFFQNCPIKRTENCCGEEHYKKLQKYAEDKVEIIPPSQSSYEVNIYDLGPTEASALLGFCWMTVVWENRDLYEIKYGEPVWRTEDIHSFVATTDIPSHCPYYNRTK